MNFPTAAFLISPGVTCSFVRRGETACGVNFVLRLDVLKSARLIHGFRVEQLPGAADIELFRYTDLRTNSSIGAILKELPL